MLLHSNIDRPDSVQVSKAPFTYESTMDMAGSIIAPGSIMSLKVYAEASSVVPFRFHSIQMDGRLAICDKNGTIVAYWQTYPTTETDTPYVSSLLYNANGVISGHITCTSDVVAIIRNIIDTNNETVFLPGDAFVLIPQCHVAMLTGKGRAIRIISQGQTVADYTGNITLAVAADDGCVMQTGDISFSLVNTQDMLKHRAPYNGLCVVMVDGSTFSCRNSSIIIKAEMLSNLRVVKDNGSIVLKGVLDA